MSKKRNNNLLYLAFTMLFVGAVFDDMGLVLFGAVLITADATINENKK